MVFKAFGEKIVLVEFKNTYKYRLSYNLMKRKIDIEQETRDFFQKVYLWMCLGLLISGLIAYIVSMNQGLVNTFLLNRLVFFGLLILQLVMVIYLVKWIKSMSADTAKIVFCLYAGTVGLTFSVIFLVFTLSSIVSIFFITSVLFAIMSMIGYFTKKDLTSIGMLLLMALIGIILASIVNMFLNNSLLDYIISWIGVIVFIGLTAYDTQRIKKQNILGNEGTDEDTKEAIMGALTLYLDFINLFLKLLRLFGKRR